MPKAAITKPNKERVVGNLTLRDYFAAKAMAALIPLAGSPPVPMAAAEMAYMVADEMLKRRDA